MAGFRKYYVSIFVALGLQLISQTGETPFSERNDAAVEFGIVPALYYNSVSFGISSVCKNGVEHAVYLSAVLIPPWLGSAALRYNCNVPILRKQKSVLYLPVWCSSRGVIMHSEEEGLSTLLLGTLGSGIGSRFIIKNKHNLRAEAGLGVSAVTGPNVQGKYEINGVPFVPAFRLWLKYIIPLKITPL
jgi:hypothetical protein